MHYLPFHGTPLLGVACIVFAFFEGTPEMVLSRNVHLVLALRLRARGVA